MYYLYDVLMKNVESIPRGQREEGDEVITILNQCGIRPLRLGMKLSHTLLSSIDEVRPPLGHLLKKLD